MARWPSSEHACQSSSSPSPRFEDVLEVAKGPSSETAVDSRSARSKSEGATTMPARPPARPARSTENGRSVGTGRLPRGVSSWLAQPRAPDDGLVCATRSQLAPFVELARTLRRSRESVEATIEGRLSHSISESSSTTGNAPTKFVALDRYIWWRLSRSTCEKRGCDLQPDQRLVPRPGPARAHGHHPIPEGGVTMSRQIVGGLHVGRPHVRIERGMGDRAMTAPRP